MEKSKKKMTLKRRWKRWKRRMMRKYDWAGTAFAVAEGASAFLVILLVAGIVLWALWPKGRDVPAATVESTPEPTEMAMVEPTEMVTVEPTAEATEAPTAEPTPTPEPRIIDGVAEQLYYQTAAPGVEYSDPVQNKLIKQKVYKSGKLVSGYSREDEIHMGPSSEFTELEGVTTFRGSNYRDGGAYGTVPENPSRLTPIWMKRIGRLDEWSGVGWTGQGSAVRWPQELKQNMNITAEKKAKDGLVEVIYATLDGNIYFLDLDDGEETRKSIDIGAPIKGSLSLDPRGYPLLYCGQGIYDVEGKRVKCGTRIWSLYDQSLLYMLNGDDDYALRAWRAFDCSPLVDGKTDTMLTVGENGILYSVKLNTRVSSTKVAVDPQVDRYLYTQSIDGKIGSENSIAVYNNYAYFATNVGIIQCVDLNTMQLVWSFDAKDDIDASLVIEVTPDGVVSLYAANELDIRGSRGASQMFKLNALTGELLWVRNSDAIYQNDDNGGGSFATPAVGKNDLSNLVYFQVARTEDTRSMVYALDKSTGDVVWSYPMGAYGWSSPTIVYTPSGKGYVFVGSSNGMLRLFDGLTGRVVAAVDLEDNIEGSPIIFNDILVVGTRGSRIYGVKIS